MYLFDTNIFLEILLDQTRVTSCEKAVSMADLDHPGWVTSFSLHAIEVILDRVGKQKQLSQFLAAFSLHPFLHCYATIPEEEREVADLASRVRLDFDDGLQYYVARKKGLTLVTLDSDFRKITDVTVKSPVDLL